MIIAITNIPQQNIPKILVEQKIDLERSVNKEIAEKLA